MKTSYGALVIGGGYFGISAAYHLAKAGISTLLLDSGEWIRGASGANFGNVQVQDASMGLSLELTLAGFRRMQGMERELESDIGYERCPSLIVAEKEAHLPELRRLFDEKKAAGMDVRWLEGKALYEAEPNLAPGSVRAASYFEQGRIYPFHYLYALLRRGRECGLALLEHARVQSILMEGGCARGVVLADGRTFRAEQVVVAAGAGTREICATAGLEVPIRSVKAECFVTEAIQPFLNCYYSSAAFFAEAHGAAGAASSLCISQSHFGNLLIAETTKPHETVAPARQDCCSQEHCENMRRLVLEFFPALREVQLLRSWVTPSPSTDSFTPILGRSPVSGLLIDAGFKSAAVMSAISGQIIADLVAKDRCDYDLSEFTACIQTR